MQRPTFDIFIGGPMGDRTDDGAGVPYSDHLTNLKQALEEIREEISSKSYLINIHSPVINEFGSIPDTVFNMIGFAELGVLDLSANSPSVMYELTLMHALGIPVIPVYLKHLIKKNKMPFYLAKEYSVVVKDFSVATLKERLLPQIEAALTPAHWAAVRNNNPITNYYGLPLVEASASNGLATGYFENFLSKLVKDTNPMILTQFSGIEKVVILKPSKLNDVGNLRVMLERRLKDTPFEIEPITQSDNEAVASEGSIRRKMTLDRVGPYIIDVPAPLSALRSSAIHNKFSKMLLQVNGPDRASVRALLHKMEAQMINQFFSTLEYLSYSADTNPELLDVKSIDELILMLEEGSAG